MNQILSIGITTFKKRKDLVKNQILNIRKYSGENFDINVIINADNKELVDNDYRKEMLNFLADLKNCYPIFLPEFKSVPKMWNTLITFSRTDYSLILGDDLIYETDIFGQILPIVKDRKSEFFTINYGFSHYVISKQKLYELGYFDERFLALGEEDGDMVHRHIERYGRPIDNILMNGILNMGKYDDKAVNSEIHVDNKPLVNKKIREKKYVPDSNGIRGMWSEPMRRVWEDYQQYPYEKFVLDNKHNMQKFHEINGEF